MKILAFAGSNSSTSINKQLVTYTSAQLQEHTVHIIDLNDYEMPLFSIDREKEYGAPDAAHQFVQQIREHDALIVSLAEHNRIYTTAFKNIFDWCSRVELKLFQQKPLFLLSTSTGKGGGINVMKHALEYLPQFGANIIAHFSLPQFKIHFDPQQGILEQDLANAYQEQLALFRNALQA